MVNETATAIIIGGTIFTLFYVALNIETEQQKMNIGLKLLFFMMGIWSLVLGLGWAENIATNVIITSAYNAGVWLALVATIYVVVIFLYSIMTMLASIVKTRRQKREEEERT